VPLAKAGELGHTATWAGPVESISFIPSIFKYLNTFQLVKYEELISKDPKIF
jgi:hypothetical protein